MNEPPRLSEKEKQVLQFLADGFTYQQIGQRLGVSTDVVRKHALVLRIKLDANNGPHVVHLAHQRGLLT